MKLYLVRHASPLTGGRLAGRRDVEADVSDKNGFDWLRLRLALAGQVWCSPARRCRQTADVLGLNYELQQDLWEQDYGEWENRPFDELPDLGDQPPEALAQLTPEGGESFEDMSARVIPLLTGAAQRLGDDDALAVVAHAGTVRAALSMVVGSAALSFAVAPLSLTALHWTGAHWAVEGVNLTAP